MGSWVHCHDERGSRWCACCSLCWGKRAHVCVSRSDIADGGASHFAETIRKTKAKCALPIFCLLPPAYPFVHRAPHILIEALTGDFLGDPDAVALVARSGLDVYAHNMETTEARTPFVRDPRAKFRQSLEVLRRAKEAQPGLITKTSIMLGVGETDEDVLETLRGPSFPSLSTS